MTKNNPMLYEAFEQEAKEIDIEELMSEMLESFNEEKGYDPTPADELRIRRMLLARKYLEKEMDHLTLLKRAVVEEWDKRINQKKEQISSISDYVESWIKNENKGNRLSLDVGTASLRRTAPRAKVIDQDSAKKFLAEHDKLDSYLKAPELDTTLLQRSYVNQFKEMVEEEAIKQIQKEKDMSKNGRITKKREGEIRRELESTMADDYFKSLPDFFEYIPEKQSLSIRMK